jgi:hypothetical protein
LQFALALLACDAESSQAPSPLSWRIADQHRATLALGGVRCTARIITGEFNRDGPCDGTTNSWAGFIPAAKFTPVG